MHSQFETAFYEIPVYADDDPGKPAEDKKVDRLGTSISTALEKLKKATQSRKGPSQARQLVGLLLDVQVPMERVLELQTFQDAPYAVHKDFRDNWQGFVDEITQVALELDNRKPSKAKGGG